MTFELDFRSFPDPNGSVSAALIPWDSAAFGLPVYELRMEGADTRSAADLDAWLTQLAEDRACLVCSKIDSVDVPILEVLGSRGFYPVETQLGIEAVVAGGRWEGGAHESSARLRPALPEDQPAIAAIASSAFWSDRFHLDPHLSNDAADRRYVDWVRRAFDASEPVYAYESLDSGAVVGFFHLREVRAGVVDVMLVAIDPALKGQGLGSKLYQSMMAQCVDLGFNAVQSRVAAHNVPSLNAFTRAGFKVTSATAVLHRFLESSDTTRAR